MGSKKSANTAAVKSNGTSGVRYGEHLTAPPSIERYPIIIGSNLSIGYVSATMRNALAGYRYQFVDVLAELLDHEPEGFTQLAKRVTAVAGARCEVLPVDAAKPRAVEIADAYRAQHEAIDDRHDAFLRLMWGIYYGVAAEEIMYVRDGAGWMIDGFQFIHSRRLNYPDWNAFDLYVWDQGPGGLLGSGSGAQLGLRIADLPQKFIVHAPALRADYQTREGLGRILSTYFMIKRLVMRICAQDFERFVRPWVIGYYSTIEEGETVPRAAETQDIQDLTAATRSLGGGSLNSATLPDSVKIELIEHASKLDAKTFLEYLDTAIQKAVNGQTHTSSPGANGSRSAGEVAERGTIRIERFDAQMFASTWRRSVIKTWTEMNFPGEQALAPIIKFHVEDVPDQTTTANVAATVSKVGFPIDFTKLAPMIGMPLDEERAAIRAAAPDVIGDPKRGKDIAGDDSDVDAPTYDTPDNDGANDT